MKTPEVVTAVDMFGGGRDGPGAAPPEAARCVTMAAMRDLPLSLLFLCLAGCPSPAAAPSPEPTDEPAAQAGPAEAPTPSGATDGEPARCAEIRQEAAAIVPLPDPACESDDDCACSPAIVDCGGPRHRSTVDRLRPLAEEARELGCDHRSADGARFNCAPRRCVPRCSSAGRCAG